MTTPKFVRIDSLAYCSAYHSSVQSIESSSWTSISLDSDEYDDRDMHDGGGDNPERIVVPADGMYIVNARLTYYANTVGLRGIGIWVNGTFKNSFFSLPVNNTESPIQFSKTYNLSADDYVEMRGWQSSGGSLNLFSGTYRCYLQLTKL